DAGDDSDDLYGAAYENVVFRDSAQDGHLGDTLDESSAQFETDLDLIAAPLESRLRFLVTLSQAWEDVAENYAGAPRTVTGRPTSDLPASRNAMSDERVAAFKHWEERNALLLADMGALMEQLAA